jgi:hypothetical protein
VALADVIHTDSACMRINIGTPSLVRVTSDLPAEASQQCMFCPVSEACCAVSHARIPLSPSPLQVYTMQGASGDTVSLCTMPWIVIRKGCHLVSSSGLREAVSACFRIRHAHTRGPMMEGIECTPLPGAPCEYSWRRFHSWILSSCRPLHRWQPGAANQAAGGSRTHSRHALCGSCTSDPSCLYPRFAPCSHRL